MKKVDINLYIVKLMFYLVPDSEFENLLLFFKTDIFPHTMFDDDVLIELQAYLNNIDEINFSKNHIELLTLKTVKILTPAQEYIILLKMYLVGLHNRKIIVKVNEIAKLFGFDNKTYNEISQVAKEVLSKCETDRSVSMNLFYELDSEIDDFILSHAIKFEETQILKKCYLNGLSSKEYEHDLDIEALKAVKKFDVVTNMVTEPSFDLSYKATVFSNLGNCIEINKNNLPHLNDLFLECCRILDIKKTPKFYIRNGGLNAHTLGRGKEHFVMLFSATVSLLTRDELMFIIGHELGHIKSNHTYYNFIAQNIVNLTNRIIGFGKVAQYPLLKWSRMAEFTADRAGFLCCQNYKAVVSTFMKLSGVPIKSYSQINIDSFLDQAERFKNTTGKDLFSKALETYIILNSTHPWSVLRVAFIKEWYENGGYSRLIDKYAGTNFFRKTFK